MNVTDNFLPEHTFKVLQKYVEDTDFNIINIGANRLISVLEAPAFILPFIQVEGYEIITAFLRESYDGFDNKQNIHADNIMAKLLYDENQEPYTVNYKVDLASVLYVNNPKGVTPNGTAFYYHEKYEQSLPETVSEEEYNRMILEDAKQLPRWKQVFAVDNKPNRFLTYRARNFHDKFPQNIEKGIRVVLVAFYKKL